MNFDTKNRLKAALPLAALLAFSVAGCGPKASDTTTEQPAPSTTSPMAPSGPSNAMTKGQDATGVTGKGAGDGKMVGMPGTSIKIKNSLLQDKTIGATGLNVSTSADGQVSLTGNVASEAAKAKAETVAKGYPEVKKVVNDLKVVAPKM